MALGEWSLTFVYLIKTYVQRLVNFFSSSGIDLQLWTGEVINCIRSSTQRLWRNFFSRFGLVEPPGAQKCLQNLSKVNFLIRQKFGLFSRWQESLQHGFRSYIHINNATGQVWGMVRGTATKFSVPWVAICFLYLLRVRSDLLAMSGPLTYVSGRP